MPELPEVETVARQLSPLVSGQRIKAVKLLDPKLAIPRRSRLHGCTITRAFRSGKRVMLGLEPEGLAGERLWLAVHLRMTGRLIYVDGSRLPRGRGSKHLRARLGLENGLLLFYDTRRFGTIELFDSLEAAAPPGLDPLSRDVNARKLAELAGNSTTPIKTWLLRQDRLTGIGNIYACEACFSARINPLRPAGSLDYAEVKRLNKELKRILRAAIRHCGTSFSDFQDAHGEVGGYVKYLKVYGHAGGPCPSCGAPIERIVQQQRSTFYCPRCQR